MQSITKTLKRLSCQPPKSATALDILAAPTSAVTLRSTPIQAVVELTAKCNQLEKEIDLAANMQQDFQSAANHDSSRSDLHSFCVPTGKTCGDALEILQLDDKHLAILMIDATGHGLAASHLATLALQTIRSWKAANCNQLLRNPSEVLTKLNNLIFQINSRDCLFVAATYAVYSEQTRSVLLARGGNPYPILYRSDSSSRKIVSQGPLLGVLANAGFENIELQLTPEDQFVICTDGLEDCGLSDDLSLLLKSVNDSTTDNTTSSLIDDRLAKFEHQLTLQAKAGELPDDVSVAVLQIPTNPTMATKTPKTRLREQLALA